jgi:hypothetical protein
LCCQLKLFEIGGAGDVLLGGFWFCWLHFVLVMIRYLHMLHLFRDMMVGLVVWLMMRSCMLMVVMLLMFLCTIPTTSVVERARLHHLCPW